MDIILILFACFLYMVCAVLLVLEIFIPSFGLLTVLAVGAFVWATVELFEMGTVIGWSGLVTAAVLIPCFWVLTYKVFPKTSLGKAMFLHTELRAIGDGIADKEQLESLLGKTGTAVTLLRPIGICQFDGKRVSCSAESGLIPKGTGVEVIRIQDLTVTVREIQSTT